MFLSQYLFYRDPSLSVERKPGETGKPEALIMEPTYVVGR